MKTYGLIGFPLEHSFSRNFFTGIFDRENREEQYLNFELEQISLLPGIIASHPDLAGLNVTIPYKQQAVSYLDRLDQVAADIGAVNTIRITRYPEMTVLEGFNTDVHGFGESFRPMLKPWHKSALILGTGGAAKAVVYSLNILGFKWLQVSRNPVEGKCISYGMLSRELLEEYLVIINTTPLGTFPDVETCPDLPYQYLTARHLLFDLVYNPSETHFLSQGRKMGAITKNGYEMLELQALKSYEIWNRQ
jgi:shikimate dehydrogenase